MQQGDTFRETELQRLLTDERSRCDQYKQLYQALKEQHGRLQEELIIIHQQLKEANEQNVNEKDSQRAYIRKLEETLSEKQEEIKKLNEQVLALDPKIVKEQVSKELKDHYEPVIKNLEDQATEDRKKYGNLHYDFMVLKCEFEALETRHLHAIELLNDKHAAEVRALQLRIEELNASRSGPVKDYSKELREAEREIVELNTKLKAAAAENKELTAQYERVTSQYESEMQIHSKQLSEHALNIQSLEFEKSTLVTEKEKSVRELSKVKEEMKSVEDKLQEAKQEARLAKNELEKCKQKYAAESSNLKKELMKQKSHCEDEKKLLADEISLLRQQLLQLNEDQKQLTLENERIFEQQLSDLKHQAWQRCSELQLEVDNAKRYIMELQSSKEEALNQYEQKLKDIKQEMETAIKLKSEYEKELAIVKSTHEEKSQKRENDNHEVLLKQNSELLNQVQDLKNIILRLTSVSGRVGDEEEIHQEKFSSKYKHQNDCDPASVLQLRLTLEQQKHEYQQRVDSLEAMLKEQRNSWTNEKTSILTKQKQYARLITKLRDKLNTEKLHLEEMEVQNELLQKNIPIEDYIQVKNKLAELQRKQDEFHQVMTAATQFASSGNVQVPGTSTFQPVERKGPLMDILLQIPSSSFLQSETSTPKKDSSQPGVSKSSFKARRKLSLKQATRLQRLSVDSSSSDIENL